MTRRLLLSYLTITALVLMILEIPLALSYDHIARDRLSTEIERDARDVAADVQGALAADSGAGRAPPPDLDAVADRYQNTVGGRVVVVDADGRSLADTDGPTARDFSTRPEIADVLGGDSVAAGRRHSNTLDADLLYVAVPVESAGNLVGAVRITFPTTELDAQVRRYWLSLGALGAFVLLTVAGVGYLLARSVTEPVRELERVADRLAGGDLSARARPGGPPEVRALADSVNEMATRLDSLVDAQRAFVANASHELRTPLTALRLQLENLRDANGHHRDGHNGRSSDPQEIEAAAAEVARLARLVDGLLGLARVEGPRPERITVDVAAEACDRVDTWSALAEEQGVQLVLALDGFAEADVVPGAVTQVLDNLLANAIDVAPPGTEIRVDVRGDGRHVELHVVDNGPGLSEAEREHAFDRFWRGNGASSGGSGLGLAIVEQLASASGGDARLLPAKDTGGVDACVRFAAARRSRTTVSGS
jgi:signal transduction histidine kinase